MWTLWVLAMHNGGTCRTTNCVTNPDYSTLTHRAPGCCCTSAGQCASYLCDYISTWTCLAAVPSPPPFAPPPSTPSSSYQLATSTLCAKTGSIASHNNWDLASNNYYSNEAHCRALCDADPACHAYTLFRNVQRCWMYGAQSVINGYYMPNGVFYDSKVGQWVPNPACPDYTSSSPYHTSSICYYWPTGDSTGATLWDCYYTPTALRNTTCDEWNVCPSPPPSPPPPRPPPPPPSAPSPLPSPPLPVTSPSLPPPSPSPLTPPSPLAPPPLSPPATPDCSQGQVWVECGSACTPTCSDPAPACTTQCVARCQCHAAIPILRSDGRSVHLNECNDCGALRTAYDEAGCCTAR